MAKFYELHRLSGESLIATEPGRNRIVQSLSQTSFKRLLQQNLPVADSAWLLNPSAAHLRPSAMESCPPSCAHANDLCKRPPLLLAECRPDTLFARFECRSQHLLEHAARRRRSRGLS